MDYDYYDTPRFEEEQRLEREYIDEYDEDRRRYAE